MRRPTSIFALLFAFAMAAPAAHAAPARRGAVVCTVTHGCLHAGEVVHGEPDLPIGWRAYPLSFFDDIFVVEPDRRRIRTNFHARRGASRPPKHRRSLPTGPRHRHRRR